MTLEVSPDLLRRQITLIGSWTFSNVGLTDCARFVADRGVDIDRLFTHRWALDQVEEACQLFDQQKTGKGVFLPSWAARGTSIKAMRLNTALLFAPLLWRSSNIRHVVRLDASLQLQEFQKVTEEDAQSCSHAVHSVKPP